MSSDKNEKRLAMFDQIIAKGTEDPFVYYGRAMALRSLDRHRDSLDAFGALAERFPDYVPTYLMAGQVAEILGLPDEARRWFERGMERAAGKDAHAHSELETALNALH